MCTLTVGQMLEGEEVIREMYAAGMRSVRINTAHLRGVEQLDTLARRLKSLLPDVRILIDTKGPEMRTTDISREACMGNGDAVELRAGAYVTVEGTAEDLRTTAEHIYVNYPLIHSEVKPGQEMLIDDGKISLLIEAVEDGKIYTRVVQGGALGSRKGMSVKGVDLSLPAVSRQDRDYIRYAATSEYIDVIAHSFVRSAADVRAVRAAMGDDADASPTVTAGVGAAMGAGKPTVTAGKPLIAKIENQQGIDNLEAILDASDGVLIARGDLTACIGAEAVPQAQAQIAAAARRVGLPLYLATNILPSMITGEKPSANDLQGIAIARRQGVDVMLLTNETAAGPRPISTVKALSAALA